MNDTRPYRTIGAHQLMSLSVGIDGAVADEVLPPSTRRLTDAQLREVDSLVAGEGPNESWFPVVACRTRSERGAPDVATMLIWNGIDGSFYVVETNVDYYLELPVQEMDILEPIAMMDVYELYAE